MTHPIRSFEEVSHGDPLSGAHPHYGWCGGPAVRYLFRQSPVPGIHALRGNVGSTLRHPRTHAARCAAEQFLAEARAESVSVHAAGGSVAKLRRLPDAYDDLPRHGGKPPRSWKRHRRTQYKSNHTVSS